jgi:hypothetical protein
MAEQPAHVGQPPALVGGSGIETFFHRKMVIQTD